MRRATSAGQTVGIASPYASHLDANTQPQVNVIAARAKRDARYCGFSLSTVQN